MSETLAEYLDRMFKQRNLKAGDVAKKTKLSPSYISRLLNGEKANMTVETIGVMVEALDLDPLELFTVAYGKPVSVKPGIDPLLLADTIQKLISKPELIELVQSAARLSPKQQKAIFGTVRALGRGPKKARKKKR